MKTATTISALMLIFCSVPMLSAIEKPIEAEDNSRRGGLKKGVGDHAKLRERTKEPDQGFKKLDLDKNGELSFEEFSQAERLLGLEVEKQRSLFDFLDQNKDGNLQGVELLPRAPRWIAGMQRAFRRIDVNKDGALDFNEFSEAQFIAEKPEKERRMLFKRFDTNEDGRLSLGEIKPRRPLRDTVDFDFTKYDIDKNGSLDYEEYAGLPFVRRFSEERRKKHFGKIDTDGSGEISGKEIRLAHKHRPHRGGEGKLPHGKRGERPKNKGPRTAN